MTDLTQDEHVPVNIEQLKEAHRVMQTFAGEEVAAYAAAEVPLWLPRLVLHLDNVAVLLDGNALRDARMSAYELNNLAIHLRRRLTDVEYEMRRFEGSFWLNFSAVRWNASPFDTEHLPGAAYGKITVLKACRELTGLGLREAKVLVESTSWQRLCIFTVDGLRNLLDPARLDATNIRWAVSNSRPEDDGMPLGTPFAPVAIVPQTSADFYEGETRE